MRLFFVSLLGLLCIIFIIQNFEEDYSNKLDMIFIEGGTFKMGSDSKEIYESDGESPIKIVTVESFKIQPTEVTNKMFQEFIKETNYITDAEKFKWSFVVETFLSEEQNLLATQAVEQYPWWIQVFGANWNHPEGNDSDISERLNHPVVHISWNDASAFCSYYNSRLPTEAEWEYAARGGLEQNTYPWGNHRIGENRKHLTNVFQGDFPYNNTGLDGYKGTAPVASYEPNNYGLYDMSGNVWEWTNDNFMQTQDIPPHKVCKGGSFMCHRKFCFRWRCSSRRGNSHDTSSQNLGFRCVQ